MNRLFSLIVLFIVSLQTLGLTQNLVPNPGFEEKKYCPQKLNEEPFPCKKWYSPNKQATPDYYHKCAGTCMLSVPNNRNGFIPARSGNAYLGLIIFGTETISSEHIQVKLKQPLKRDSLYEVTLYSYLSYKDDKFCSQELGLRFSQNKIFKDRYMPFSYLEHMKPEFQYHISLQDKEKLCDTGWVQISGYYKARGGEKYMTIGLFWNNDKEIVNLWKKYQKDSDLKYTKKLRKRSKKYMVRSNPFYGNIELENECQHEGISTISYYMFDDVSVLPATNDSTIKTN